MKTATRNVPRASVSGRLLADDPDRPSERMRRNSINRTQNHTHEKEETVTHSLLSVGLTAIY
jgi:hypothetical protein